MIAKGQVEIINQITEGNPNTNKHAIYLNLKALPNTDTDVLHKVYEKLYNRALQLKETLNPGFETLLCVGNFENETENNLFFTKERGFKPHFNLYIMERDGRYLCFRYFTVFTLTTIGIFILVDSVKKMRTTLENSSKQNEMIIRALDDIKKELQK